MAIAITTNFYPYRMSLKKKEPVELKVGLINNGEKDAMITFQVLVSRQLSLDKSGISNSVVKRIEKFPPGERKNFVFDLFPKGYAIEGNYPIVLKVMEHYQQFKFVEREFTKNLDLSVEE